MNAADAQMHRRMRGQILLLLRENHEAQRSRMDDVTLTGVLDRLKFDVSVNLVRTLLQDMSERELVRFSEEKDRKTGVVSIRQIQITWYGRDVLEGTVQDRSVEVME